MSLILTPLFSCAAEPHPMKTPAPEAYERGKQEAQEDLAAGVLKIRGYGLPEPRWSNVERILKREYGVQVDEAGCVVDSDIIESIRGYNEISKPELERRFGPHFMERIAERAKAEFEVQERFEADDLQALCDRSFIRRDLRNVEKQLRTRAKDFNSKAGIDFLNEQKTDSKDDVRRACAAKLLRYLEVR